MMKTYSAPLLPCSSSIGGTARSHAVAVRKGGASFCPRRLTEFEREESTPTHVANLFNFKNPMRKAVKKTKKEEIVKELEEDYGMTLQQGLREDMEDYATVASDGVAGHFYGAVFDGHMGKKTAAFLTENLQTALDKALKKDPAFAKMRGEKGFNDETFRSLLKNVFVATDEKLLDYLAKDGGSEWNCGSTATVLLAREDQIIVANVGDSRAVLARGGRALDLSSEHRPYGRDQTAKNEAKRIEDTGAWIRDGRVMGILAVTRAFGDVEFKRNLEQLLVDGVLDGCWTKEFAKKQNITGAPVICEPDVTALERDVKDEFVMLASDGLWEVFSSAQAVSFVRRHLAQAKKKGGMSPCQAAAEAIVDDAIKRRKSSDNVACIILSLT